MISQNNNRVKAIKNRFENLNESTTNSSEQSRKITVKNKIDHTTSSSLKQLCKQETRHNAPSCSHIPNNRVLNNGCTKNESNRNINNKVHDRLLQMQEERIVNKLFKNRNQSDSSSSDEVYGSSLPYETFENDDLDSVDRENKDFEYPETTDRVPNNNNFRLLSRQCSDPGRKLQRSHAFRCDRSQKISPSPKRHSFCHGRLQSEMPTLKIGEKPRISKEKLRKLGQVLEDRMRRDNFVPAAKLNNSFEDKNIVSMDSLDGIQRTRKIENSDVLDMNIQNLHVSLPDDEVPRHILDQYAKVLKPKKKHINDDTITDISLKQDPMTDSGVSSETENVVQDNDNPQKGRLNLKKLRAQFEGLSENCTEVKEFDMQRSKKQNKKLLKKTNRVDDDIDAISEDKENSNLNSLHRKSDELHSSTDTIKRLEIKNPHIVLTDTLKKALKQPLPTGPPPKKPPRTFANAKSESLPNSPLSSPRPLCKLSNLHEESPSTKKPKKDSKLMLEKIERALKKHTDSGKLLSPRSNKNVDVANEKNLYDIVEGETTIDCEQNNRENTVDDKNEIHYMCTELLDLPYNNKECQNNVSSKENNSNLSNSFTKCLNSLNCGIMTTRSSSSIAYARLSSASASSSNGNSLTSICCACNGENLDSVEEVTVENKNKFSTFFNFKCPTEDNIDLCQKCGINIRKNDKFQCHLGCRCDNSKERRKHDNTLSDDMIEEHIYAEPYIEMSFPNSGETGTRSVIQTARQGVGVKSIHNDSGMVAQTSDDIIGNAVEVGGSGKRRSVRDILKKWECADENNCGVIKESQSLHCLRLSDNVRNETGLKCLADTGFSKSLDVQSPAEKDGLYYESTQIYDIPCDDDNISTRSSSPDLDSNPYSLIDEHSPPSLIHTLNRQPISTPERRDVNTSKRTTPDRDLRTQRKSLTPERPQVTPRNGVTLFTNDTKVRHLKQASDRQRSRTPDFDSKSGVKVPKINLNLRTKIGSPDKNTEFDKIKLSLEKKFATEGKSAKKESRYEKRDGFKTVAGNRRPDSACLEARSSKKSEISSLFRKSGHERSQLDIDRDNLNRLMNEIYETVSAACVEGAGSREAAAMIGRDQGDVSTKPAKFPVDTGNDTSSEDSIKLTRSLTDRRKNYVRRVSSRAAYAEPHTQTVGRVRVGRAYRHQTSVSSTYDSGNLYATFRSWKSFKQQKCMSKSDADFPSGESMDADVTDDTAVEIDPGVDARADRLYEMCLLVGLNHITGQAYIKSVFPEGTHTPPQIENLVFPETVSLADESLTSSPSRRRAYDLDASHTQCYSLVLTNERGERAFGYCRRVLPEGASFCLPLAYCLVSRYRAPGFFYKILQELESHHGSSDLVLDSILQQLLDTDFPEPGESITLTHVRSPKRNSEDLHKNSLFRNSVNLGDVLKSKTLADPSRCSAGRKDPSEHMLAQFDDDENRFKSHIPEFYNVENNNKVNCHRKVAESKSVEIPRGPRQEVRTIKRPIEPRMDDDNLSVLMDSISVSLLVKIFGTLLLERKVVLVSDKLSQLSSCIEALQSILYPFVWQHTLISTIPSGLRRDILEAPIPILAGVLRAPGAARENPDGNVDDGWDGDLENVRFEEGMLVDLSTKNGSTKVIFMQGDESTILPSQSYKNLKTSLHLESSKNFSAKTEKLSQNGARYHSDDDQMEKTRNVLVAEAFLRFFVDLLGNYWQYFSVSARKPTEEEEGESLSEFNVVFEKENFIKSTPTKHIQYFLEWFTETAMFNHFVENMAKCYPHRRHGENERVLDYALIDGLIDLPFPNFYEALDERATRRLQKQNESGKKGTKSDTSIESGGAKTNFKHKLKVWKNKLKEFAN